MSEELQDNPVSDAGNYPGLGRGKFLVFLLVFYLGFGTFILFDESNSDLMLAAVVVLMIGYFVASAYRLHNIGYHPAWVLALLLPIINLFISVACAAYPAGYKQHKQIDAAAYVIAAIYLALILAGVFLD